MQFFKSAVVTAVALCAALAVQARTLDEVKKDGKIIVATEGQFAPFNYFEGTKLTGFEVEVAELVVKKMGLKLEWKTLGFDALLTGLGQNAKGPAINAMTAIAANHQRRMAPHATPTRGRTPGPTGLFPGEPESEVVADGRRRPVHVGRVRVAGLRVDCVLLRLTREEELRLTRHVNLNGVLKDLERVGEVEADATGDADGHAVEQVGALRVLLRNRSRSQEGAQPRREALADAVLRAEPPAERVGEARSLLRGGHVERAAQTERLERRAREIDGDAHPAEGPGKRAVAGGGITPTPTGRRRGRSWRRRAWARPK